jgi:acetylornithine deacetylase/succinyl-diaminopimelate desuccinylase-like protein
VAGQRLFSGFSGENPSQEHDPAFDAEISDQYYLPVIEPPDDASLTDLALEIAYHTSGKRAEVRGFTGCTDASILVLGKGIPVLIYGPGNADGCLGPLFIFLRLFSCLSQFPLVY